MYGEFDFEGMVCPIHGDEDIDPGGIESEGEGAEYCVLCPPEDTETESPIFIEKWRYVAPQYFDLALTNGDTEKFWKDLLNPSDA